MKPTCCKHAMPLEMYCPHCEIEKLKDQLSLAHREGWEQGKAEAIKVCTNKLASIDIFSEYVAGKCNALGWAEDTIAAMEYKEKANDP